MKNFSGFAALLKKELTIYFAGPIFYITGFFFVLTEALLIIFMYRYAGQPGTAPRAGKVTGRTRARQRRYAMFSRCFRCVTRRSSTVTFHLQGR